MKNQLSVIREIILELKMSGETEDYYSLPEKLEIEFQKVNDALFEIWVNKPYNMDEILHLNLIETTNLMAMISDNEVNHSNIANLKKGEVGFRREIDTRILNGLFKVFSQLQMFNTGDDLNLTLRSYTE